MKRLITAVSFAVLAVPAFAAERGAPFEQTELDRVLPEVPGGGERVMVASIGDTVYVSAEESDGASPWASDHNFIAPAQ